MHTETRLPPTFLVTVALLVSALFASETPGFRQNEEAEFPLVHVGATVGAIIPSSHFADLHDRATIGRRTGIVADGFWDPVPSDVRPVRARVEAALKSALQDLTAVAPWTQDSPMSQAYLREEIAKIITNLQSYHCQYVGTLLDGRKRIHLNFFPSRETEGDGFATNWLREYVVVLDGGFWFWQIEFDVEADRFVYFVSNGYA